MLQAYSQTCSCSALPRVGDAVQLTSATMLTSHAMHNGRCAGVVGPSTSARPLVSARSARAAASGLQLKSKADYPAIICGQGPPPPNPLVVERFQGVVSQLFQQRIVRLGGAVDDDMANLLVAQLLYLDSVDQTKDITMYVNSPGGSVTAGMAVFDTMRHIRPDVSTCCIGMAASMGAFILASGQLGKRYSLPNSRIMIHQPLGGAQGQATDIEIQANEILHHKLTLNGYLAQFCSQSMETITKDTDRDFFMSPQEAIEYGLIDAIIAKPLLLQSRQLTTTAA